MAVGAGPFRLRDCALGQPVRVAGFRPCGGGKICASAGILTSLQAVFACSGEVVGGFFMPYIRFGPIVGQAVRGFMPFWNCGASWGRLGVKQLRQGLARCNTRTVRILGNVSSGENGRFGGGHGSLHKRPECYDFSMDSRKSAQKLWPAGADDGEAKSIDACPSINEPVRSINGYGN